MQKSSLFTEFQDQEDSFSISKFLFHLHFTCTSKAQVAQAQQLVLAHHLAAQEQAAQQMILAQQAAIAQQEISNASNAASKSERKSGAEEVKEVLDSDRIVAEIIAAANAKNAANANGNGKKNGRASGVSNATDEVAGRALANSMGYATSNSVHADSEFASIVKELDTPKNKTGGKKKGKKNSTASSFSRPGLPGSENRNSANSVLSTVPSTGPPGLSSAVLSSEGDASAASVQLAEGLEGLARLSALTDASEFNYPHTFVASSQVLEFHFRKQHVTVHLIYLPLDEICLI
jgi:hypothetical protein